MRAPGLPITHNGTVVLEEEIDESYQPTEQEIFEYAAYLGIDPIKDRDLLWIAKEGLKAPLPEPWKPCKTPQEEIYYFNFETGESIWEHPCDQYYKKLYQEEKMKKMRVSVPQPRAESGVKAKLGINTRPAPAKLVNLPTRVGSKVAIEKERLEKEYKEKLDKYEIQKNQELANYREELKLSLNQFGDNDQILNKYKETQKASLITQEKTLREDLKAKLNANKATILSEHNEQLNQKKNAIKQSLNDIKNEDETLWKQKKDIELEKIRNLEKSRVELEKAKIDFEAGQMQDEAGKIEQEIGELKMDMQKGADDWVALMKLKNEREIQEFVEELKRKKEKERESLEENIEAELKAAADKMAQLNSKKIGEMVKENERRQNTIKQRHVENKRILEQEYEKKISELSNSLLSENDKKVAELKHKEIVKVASKVVEEEMKRLIEELKMEEARMEVWRKEELNKEKKEYEEKVAQKIEEQEKVCNQILQEKKISMDMITEEIGKIRVECESINAEIEAKKKELCDDKILSNNLKDEHESLRSFELALVEHKTHHNTHDDDAEILELRRTIDQLNERIKQLISTLEEASNMKVNVVIVEPDQSLPDVRNLMNDLKELKTSIATLAKRPQKKPDPPPKPKIEHNTIDLNGKMREIAQFIENEKMELLNGKENLLEYFEVSKKMLGNFQGAKLQSNALSRKLATLRSSIKKNEKKLYVIRLMERKMEVYQNSVSTQGCEHYSDQCEKELREVYRIYMTKYKFGARNAIRGSTGETEDYLS